MPAGFHRTVRDTMFFARRLAIQNNPACGRHGGFRVRHGKPMQSESVKSQTDAAHGPPPH
jgi:hypothetical protein